MLDMLEIIESNSMDAIVTDPPYELNFMNKGWDNSGVAFQKETWEKCYKVLKPGAYLLAFGGTRTFHRIACAIEDAGFEIRDTIMWLYGSGFPKSMNIGKFVDKREGNERQKTGRILHHAQKGVAVAEERGAVGGGSFGIEHYEEETIGTSVWEGWGTCLKPSYEPIIVARKPCEGSIIDNVLKYGVGGINIDGCKFSGEDSTERDSRGRFPANVILTYDESDKDEVCGGMPEGDRNGSISKPYDMNNLVYGDYGQCNTFEAYEDSGSASRYFYCAKATIRDREEGLEEIEAQSDFVKGNGLGRVCEFCGAPQLKPELCKCPVKSWVMPKRKNIHPTVKPTMLMQYLVRLVTPMGGTVLDPFSGSGSTGKAVMYENLDYASGYKYIGIEITEKYLPIAKARIENADKTLATEEDRFTFDGIVTTEETVDGEDW